MDYVLHCIETMLAQGSDGLLLVAGNQPVIRVDGKGKAIASSPTTVADLTDFLSEGLSLPIDPLIADSTESYIFGGGASPVNVKKVVASGKLSLQIYPATASAETPAAPPPVAIAPDTSTPAVNTSATSAALGGRLVTLLNTMITNGASDLHLCTDSSPYLRKDGEMVPLPDAPFSNDELHSVLMEIIPERNRIEFAEKYDTDFA